MEKTRCQYLIEEINRYLDGAGSATMDITALRGLLLRARFALEEAEKKGTGPARRIP